jgi:hypothetical protein
MSDPQIQALTRSVDYFASVLRMQEADEPDVERVMDGYLDHKRTIALEMQRLAIRHLDLDLDALGSWRSRVEDSMPAVMDGLVTVLPGVYFKVRGFTGVHPRLYAYLERHAGRSISGSRLRILTADQVHTERRVRELRDLGLSVHTTKSSGEDLYTLDLGASDVEFGALTQLSRNLKELQSAPATLRRDLRAQIEAELEGRTAARNPPAG